MAVKMGWSRKASALFENNILIKRQHQCTLSLSIDTISYYNTREKGDLLMKKSNPIALLPIGVFLVLYLGLGILFEYVLKIPMGFYNIPIIIAFLAAILVACLQNRNVKFDEKLELMAQGLADKNIITMLLIFLTAGTFVGVVGRSSAESVAYFMLGLIPTRFAVVVLFVVACFVSTAMGTSVGTITLLTPIAVAVSTASGFDLPLCIGSVMGGAMFGDNLSFISDTTIAACNGQGCAMKDKFRENFGIALPAALATVILILVLSFRTQLDGAVVESYNLIQIVPYVLVLIGGIAGDQRVCRSPDRNHIRGGDHARHRADSADRSSGKYGIRRSGNV